jgi:trimeric autotransporter adhesin
MALVVYDRVQETTTTSGTGSVTLLGAVSGFQSFAVVGNSNTTYYTITDGAQWEVGIGTYSTSGPTLARTTVLSNSNGNTTPITLSGGTAQVFVTYTAEKSVNLDASGNVTPLGTIASGTWQGTTVGVSYGGTGVTASSGASSVVLRDANQNTSINNIFRNTTSTVSAAGTTVLTAASSFTQVLTGTLAQTYQLPDATTLVNGASFQFNNNSTGLLTIVNNGSGAVATVAAGGAAQIFLTSTSTSNGTWDVHGYIPENVTWGTNALSLGSTVITGGTWNGGTIGTAYGGTGLTSFTSGGALYATSTSSLTSGTLPVTAGGTAATTFTANGVLYGSGTSALGVTSAGTTGQVLLANTSGAPTWGSIPSTGAVTSFQTSLNGLTPSTASTGAVTLAGTLGPTSGGTGLSAYTTGDIIYASATNTLSALADVATGNALISGGVGVAPSWGKIGLTTHVSGTLPVANGGTGQTTYTDGQLLIGNSTGNTLTKASLTAGTGISITPGSGSISIASTVTSGLTITNDTTTATALYPTFTSATSGSISGASVTSTKLTFVPTTGSLTAPQTVASNGLVVNSNTVSASYSIPSGSSATSTGPMTVNSGVVVTVPSGSRWVVL